MTGDGERGGRRTRGPDKKPRAKNPNSRNAPLMLMQQPSEGFSAKQIDFLMEIMPTEPLDPNDAAEMDRRFRHYLETCKKYDMKVGNLNAYFAVGIDARCVDDYMKRPEANPARTAILKKIKAICGAFRENAMQQGEIDRIVGIFYGKNWDGLKDVQETVVTRNDPLGDVKTIEALKDRYLPPIEPKKIVDTSAVDVDESTE